MICFHRFNSGKGWGLGHLYRNISLMKALQNIGITCIAVTNLNERSEELLNINKIHYVSIPEYEEAEELANIVKSSFDYINISEKCVFWDRLDSTREYMLKLRDEEIKVVTYGNYSKSSFLATCAIISRDTLIGGKEIFYSGPKYQLLSAEVEKLSEKDKIIKNTVTKVLINFGGTDPNKILSRIFECLKGFGNMIFYFIDTAEKINGTVEAKCDGINYIYMPSTNRFAELLYECDLCIIAGGVSMYEAAAVGTPMININQNEDQSYAASIFAMNTGSINMGNIVDFDEKMFLFNFKELCNDYERRKKMSSKMKSYVDAKGVTRVSSIIRDVLSGNSVEVVK